MKINSAILEVESRKGLQWFASSKINYMNEFFFESLEHFEVGTCIQVYYNLSIFSSVYFIIVEANHYYPLQWSIFKNILLIILEIRKIFFSWCHVQNLINDLLIKILLPFISLSWIVSSFIISLTISLIVFFLRWMVPMRTFVSIVIKRLWTPYFLEMENMVNSSKNMGTEIHTFFYTRIIIEFFSLQARAISKNLEERMSSWSEKSGNSGKNMINSRTSLKKRNNWRNR